MVVSLLDVKRFVCVFDLPNIEMTSWL